MSVQLVDNTSSVLLSMQQNVQGLIQRFDYLNAKLSMPLELPSTDGSLPDVEEPDIPEPAKADRLTGSLLKLAAAYMTLQSVGSVIRMADQFSQTTARIDAMNDGLQTTGELSELIYSAAQRARGSYGDMADVVARFGNNARDAFSSSAEVVEFAELVQKQMVIAGAGTQEASNAMTQLSQALGSGVLRGDELNSIFEQAPNLIRTIADDLNVPIASIRQMASEGQLTADVVKNAILNSADEINASFEAMPVTWGQVWQMFQNDALRAFAPVFYQVERLANNPAIQMFIASVANNLSILAGISATTLGGMNGMLTFVAQNWSVISPLIAGVTAALAAYVAVLAIYNASQAISNGIMGAAAFMDSVKAASTMVATGSTFAATVAQHGFNAALLACPITWIVLAVIGLIAALFAICQAFANAEGGASSAFGVMSGGVMVVIGFFGELWEAVVSIFSGIWAMIQAVAGNISVAFGVAIAGAESVFWNLLATAMSVISQIASALSKLPFVEFDAAGLGAAADDYVSKASAAANRASGAEYQDVGAAFTSVMQGSDAFKGDWVGKNFDKGAAWGDQVSSDVSNGLDNFMNSFKVTDAGEMMNGYGAGATYGGSDSFGALSDIAGSAGAGAGSLGKIADSVKNIENSVDVTSENLKYMRTIAERDAVNRYTLASVNVDMSGMKNEIKNGTDFDGFIKDLTTAVDEAVHRITEGVHT